MGRKNLTEERSAEILEAFGRSIVKHGLDVSLEQVAQEAGMTRSIIRHYIGNREEVINMLVERTTQTYVDELRAATTNLSEDRALAAVLDFFFDENYAPDAYEKVLLDVMLTAKERYPQAKQRLLTMIQEFVNIFADILRRTHSHASEANCQHVAYSIIALALSNESLMWLGFNKQYGVAARRHADLLIQSLERK